MDSETARLIKEEVSKQLNIILSGSAGENTVGTEDIMDLYPGMPTIEKRPIMHPFGISSRAPLGTISVVGRQGTHVGNRIVMGHRDKNRPMVDSGEVMLYNESGQKIYLKNGSILVGTEASNEPMVLGNVLKQCLSDFFDAFINCEEIGEGAMGSVFIAPALKLLLTDKKEEFIETASTNILSQLVFTERGGS